MQARYYDPVIGRFLSIDPVGFSPDQPFMFGRYTYVGNDPINGFDPDGRDVCTLKGCSDQVWIHTGEPKQLKLHGAGEYVLYAGAAASATVVSLAVPGEEALLGRASGGARLFLLRQGASKSFGGASKYITKTIGQLEKTGGRSGVITWQTSSNGGRKAANDLFKTLTKGYKIRTNPNGSIQGKLKDGSVVQMGGDSAGGTSVRVTREVIRSGSRISKKETIKVRFTDAD